MKKLILTALIAIACSGCSVISGSRDAKTGTLTISTIRFAWQSEGIRFKTRSPDGFEVTLEVGRSASDPATAKAIAEGVAAGIVKGAKGTP